MRLSLYANANREHPRVGLVKSAVDPVPVNTLGLVFGDKVEIELRLVDGTGGYDVETDDETVAPSISIGLPGQAALAYLDSFTGIANGWLGTLNLNTAAVSTFLNGVQRRNAFLEIRYTNASSQTRTPAQVEIELLRELIVTGSPSSLPSPTYPTQSASDLSYVQNRYGVTGFTGGGSTKVDGIVTDDMALGSMIAVSISQIIYFYRFEVQSEAESSPNIIIPDDDATRQWRLLAQTENVHVHTQSTPAATWSGTHNFGRIPSSHSLWIGGRLAFGVLDCTTTNFTLNLSENSSGTLYLTR